MIALWPFQQDALGAIEPAVAAARRHQLAADAVAGDVLAIDVLGAWMIVTCPASGGDRWKPEGLDRERCGDCGAWSPCCHLRSTE
jgi:hypothetical protein